MLTRFAVTNYRGFAERLVFDLSNPGKYDFNTHAIKNGVVKDAIVYGSNGSGKSNLGFAVFDIVHHLTQKTKQLEYGRNYSYAGAKDDPVSFEYVFAFDDDQVVYSYSKNKSAMLLEEQLVVNGIEWFHRNGGLSVNADLFSVSDDMKEKWKNPANNTSFLGYLSASYPMDRENPIVKLLDFVDNMLLFWNLEGRGYIGFGVGDTTIEKFIIENRLVDELARFFSEISGQEFDFVEPKPDDEMLYCAINGTSVPFNYIRSTGTNSLLLLFYWYVHMSKLPFVFIDEFDAFYHFELSKKVCKKLFELPNTQVVLTTHNTHLMSNDLLRPDCNFILEENKIKSLNDCTEKELRQGHNIEKLYRGGTFSV